MSRLVTLGSLRARVQERANMEGNDPLVSEAEFNQYINDSAAELDDILFLADQSTGRESTTISMVAGTDHYPLPSDFRAVLGVEYQINSNQTPPWIDIHRRNFNERNRYSYAGVPYANGYYYRPFHYYLESQGQGNAAVWYLVLTPPPGATGTVRVWYRPVYLSMVEDTDAIDGGNGWDEYVVIDAAIKCLQKEESDVSVLMAQKQAMLQRIEAMSKDRDANEPERISDVGQISGYEGLGYGWGCY
jgi:hypothetical protein